MPLPTAQSRNGAWHMPTLADWRELFDSDNCACSWFEYAGTPGYKIQSKIEGYTDKWIFLPAAGYMKGEEPVFAGQSGYYFSSEMVNSYCAETAKFTKNSKTIYEEIRPVGCPVRPVRYTTF